MIIDGAKLNVASRDCQEVRGNGLGHAKGEITVTYAVFVLRRAHENQNVVMVRAGDLNARIIGDADTGSILKWHHGSRMDRLRLAVNKRCLAASGLRRG